MIAGVVFGATAMLVNKFSLVIKGCSTPNFPWKNYASYVPSIQEWFITFGILTTMAMIYSWTVKKLPIFSNHD